MHELLLAQKCASVNFKKWLITPQIWITAAVIFVFALWNLSGVTAYSSASGIKTAPWIFPHFFFMPVMVTVYGFLTICLFSAAPFRDDFSQFMEIRMGKRIWICGQLLYILETSTVYVLYYVLITVVMILPRIFLTPEWGNLIKQLCYEPYITEEYGISLGGLYFSTDIIENFTPIQAMLLAMLMLWLVSAWLGTLIFVLHIVLKKGAGIIAAGFFVFLAYFANYVGWIMMGNRIFFFSPVNWLCLAYLNIAGRGDLPDLWYALSILVFCIIVFGGTGVKVYCAKEN